MKLAIIHPFQFRYARGIERFTWSLINALHDIAVEVDLLTWKWPNPVNWGKFPMNMQIRRMPYVRYFMDRVAIVYYFRWLIVKQYDCVIIFFAGYGEAEVLSLLSKFRKQPYCIVFHYPYEQVPHRYAEFKRFQIAQNAGWLVAVSEFVANGVESYFGRKCEVIGNGVDPSIFQANPKLRIKVRKELDVAQDAPVLISLAALEERKGVQWVIRAIVALLPEFPNLQYWILGEGSYRTTLEAEIRQLDLECHIRFLGNISDVVSYLAAADIGCLLSYGESFGIALIEYMATELPIVTSCHPPFGELVQPEWGVMVDEQDTVAVVRELRALLLSADNRKAMGLAGRKQVQQRHSWEQVAENYLCLLDGIK